MAAGPAGQGERSAAGDGFSRRLDRSFAVAAAGVVLAAATLLLTGIVARRADKWTARSRDVARLAREVGAFARDRETGVRGYLLTHDPRSLAPDVAAGPPMRAALDSLLALTADDPSQHERARALAAALASWESGFAAPVRAGRLAGTGPAGAPAADTTLAGKPLFDEVRRQLGALLDEEERQYGIHRRRRDTLGYTLGVVLLGELAILLLMLQRYRRMLVRQGAMVEEQQYALESQAVELELQSETLQRSNAQLLEANDELQAFAYSVAHDLRAPLRTVNGFAGLLEADHSAALDAEGRRLLTRIRAATVRGGALIDGLLGLAKLRRDELKRSRVDLGELAARVVEDLQRGEPERRVDVDIAPDLVAEGDPHLLSVVLQNLVGNAWKFTRDRAPARIEIGREATAGERGERAFFVRDNGVGFDQAFAGQLFGMFTRLHGAEFPGTGIGLATVRRVVERHGGSVWAEGRTGEGATFYFTLPQP